MLAIVLSFLCLASDPATRPSAEDRARYEAALATTGRDADAHVRLALWCESRGLTPERARHLAIAVALAPDHATARGLLGLVPDSPRWRRPETVADRLSADPERAALLTEYEGRRAKAPATAEGQWLLALWCEKAGLMDEARAHLTATVRIDPSRDAAWKRLGCKKVGGRWLTDAEVAARKAGVEAQKAADRRWKVMFSGLKERLQQPTRAAKAETDLAGITDPRTVPSVPLVFSASSRAVQLLGQIDGPTASQALAMLAIAAPTDPVRRTAAETLSRRDPSEFVDSLVSAIVPKVRYQIRHVGGPGDSGVLLIEGKEFDRRRTYAPPPNQTIIPQPGDSWGVDEYGLPVLFRLLGYAETRMSGDEVKRDLQADLKRKTSLPGGSSPVAAFVAGKLDQARHASDTALLNRINAPTPGSPVEPSTPVVETSTPLFATIRVGQMQVEATRSAVAAERQLAADVSSIDSYNEAVDRFDARISAVLAPISGVDYRDEVASWQRWSADLRGYASTVPPRSNRPTLDEDVPIDYQPNQFPISLAQGPTTTVIQVIHSCFVAGTMVKTRSGDRPIETLSTGDVVLSRDAETGRLAFQPVVAVFHNPPAETFRVGFGDREVVATGIHRFWKAGAGWVMARDLKPGDRVRTVEGVEKVTGVVPAPRQKVFNLQVDGGHSFFVGAVGAMVHDNSLVHPTSSAFDRVPDLSLAPGSPGAGQ